MVHSNFRTVVTLRRGKAAALPVMLRKHARAVAGQMSLFLKLHNGCSGSSYIFLSQKDISVSHLKHEKILNLLILLV